MNTNTIFTSYDTDPHSYRTQQQVLSMDQKSRFKEPDGMLQNKPSNIEPIPRPPAYRDEYPPIVSTSSDAEEQVVGSQVLYVTVAGDKTYDVLTYGSTCIISNENNIFW
jgi:hypothetical protein